MQTYSQEPGYVVAVAPRCLIHVVRERTTATTVSLLRRAFADLSDRYPTFGYLGIIEPDAQIMLPPDIREGVGAIVRRYSSRFTGAAVVVERAGFHGTAVRSLMTAINFSSHANHPSQVFASLPDAACWLTRLTPGDLTPARLVQLARELRTVSP